MGGKYQAYPEYKDSGVEWLGDIPSHWKLTRIKFITQCLDGARIPLNAQERGEMQGDIPYWGANKVVDHINDYIFDEELVLVGEDGAPFFDSTKDVSFNVTGKIWPNNHVHILRPLKNNIESRFLKYALNCADYHLYVSGSTRDKLNQSDLNEIYIRSSELSELTNIANFLDHETAKIDTLIEKQQQLIKLLKEKHQAVISHAVTKGLNPDAPMHDSGVEWLGEVPEHWTQLQIRRILSAMEQGKSPECDNRVAEEHEWGVLKTSCVNNGIYNSDANKALPNGIDPFPQYEVKKGDILMSRASGSIDLIGSVAYVYETRPRILLSDKVFRLHLAPQVNRLFFSYLMCSSYMRSNIERAISGAEGMANNITKGAVIGFRFVLPPLEEQEEITNYISGEVDKLDGLVLKSKFSIELMQERRTTLISAAVTGKIDVRDWQALQQINKEDAA